MSSQIERFRTLKTPFYYYDLSLLDRTLRAVKSAAQDYTVHYALKANAHPRILECVREAGLGADCVSGNEVRRALECGFPASSVAFAGVGKTDDEIAYALSQRIFCFNVESLQELHVIDEIAARMQTKAPVALRINPNVDAYTHKYITTGLEENKFGINPYEFEAVIAAIRSLKHVTLEGLHFHIGSQIQDMTAFRNLCLRVNELARWFTQQGIKLRHLNLGGGLGVDYMNPDESAIPDFGSYFGTFRQLLEPPARTEIHFELGRSIVAQCGTLITRVVFVKHGINTNFAILDAGMTELLRPALYQAYHRIENLEGGRNNVKYDVVGPVCESSDCFGKSVFLPETKRGDLIAIRTAGAYGESMSSHYNLRHAEPPVFEDSL